MATNDSQQSLQKYPPDDPNSPLQNGMNSANQSKSIFMAWDGFWGLSQNAW
eukprot:CAMPEP_0201574920 /NCGR_PEP_ID=MMETSP0190_2-20130828/19731_1 /ASSEMBLY_ACC=CAM_ASM_000263 /TAXON_ID=37353 /ORGANISM="Rosalina sp." /LENGTH=50 /DNA_ID=CAMNT_0048003845 /DNA_START=21 /DNA_END=170 /DNA_ORIENTATION=+